MPTIESRRHGVGHGPTILQSRPADQPPVGQMQVICWSRAFQAVSIRSRSLTIVGRSERRLSPLMIPEMVAAEGVDGLVQLGDLVAPLLALALVLSLVRLS